MLNSKNKVAIGPNQTMGVSAKFISRKDYIANAILSRNKLSTHHIAIFSDSWIDAIFSGKKTIDSRFSKVRLLPFGKVSQDDVVFIKESGGYIRGLFFVSRVEFHENLTLDAVRNLYMNYKEQIFGDPFFIDHWPKWLRSNYATLIWLESPVLKFTHGLPYRTRCAGSWHVCKQHLCIDIKVDINKSNKSVFLPKKSGIAKQSGNSRC